MLALMILCGGAIFFGLFSSTRPSAFTWRAEVMNIFTDGSREYGKYPFGVYGRQVLLVLTFLVPLALVQHWPLQYLLGRGPGWYGALPLASLLFLPLCWAVWRLGVRHYRSTGS
ncbi:MAG: ABC-2 family transporter protein [Dysosmobacter welbionis]